MSDIRLHESPILVPPHVAALQPYQPGLNADDIRTRFGVNRVVKLASNENPLGVSPVALERARQSLDGMSRYPTGGATLRNRLAELHGVNPGNVIVGAGSEGIMANIVRTFLCDDDEVLTTQAAFQGFQVLARSRGVPYRTVPYKDWRYDLTALADSISSRTKLIYLANPNNPTGTFFRRKELEEFHRLVPGRVLLILDEAYYEFAFTEPGYPDSMHYRFDNVITLRTFSKAYGLASARIGYGFGHEELVSVLLKVKLPFEPSGPAEAAALGALEDREFMLRTAANNACGMSFINKELTRVGVHAVPSAANFLMLVFGNSREANYVFEALLALGVIIRPLAATGLPNCLRVSIGTPDENEMFIEAVDQVCHDLRERTEVDSYAAID